MFFEDPDERISDYEIDDFVHTDEEHTRKIKYESVTLVDALDMANEAWENGASFDTDIRIIKDAVDSDPVRVVSKERVIVRDTNMYCVWAVVTVNSCDYPVPIRFYADAEDFDNCSFEWSMEHPVNSICLSGVVEVLKNREHSRWSELLDR